MSSVRIVVPKLKLTAQIRAAGGPAVADALAQVAENLAELRPQCREELKVVSLLADASLAALPQAFAAEPVRELYAIASRGVGMGAICGLDAADQTLTSLCCLLDQFLTAGRWDPTAIAVHVHALRLLVGEGGENLPAEAIAAILDGLSKVNLRYA